MWTLKDKFAIGGLREIGFFDNTDLLLVLSSQGRGLFDCLNCEKIARDSSDYYSNEWNCKTGIVKGIGHLSDKEILCGGFEYQDILSKNPIDNLKVIIEKEQRKFWNGKEHECEVMYISDNNIKTEIEISTFGFDRAFGFSKTGKSFVFATSSDISIWNKE